MDPLVENILSAGLQVLAYALLILAAYLGKKVNDYLKEKGLKDAFDELRKNAETIVRALEQEGMLLDIPGEEKKAMAMNFIRAAAEKLGLNVSDDLLSFMIEEFVQIINTEAGKFNK